MFHTVAQPASSTAMSVGRARNVHINAPLPILPPGIILTHPVIFAFICETFAAGAVRSH